MGGTGTLLTVLFLVLMSLLSVIVMFMIVIVLTNRTTGGEPTAKLFLAIFHQWTGITLCPSI